MLNHYIRMNGFCLGFLLYVRLLTIQCVERLHVFLIEEPSNSIAPLVLVAVVLYLIVSAVVGFVWCWLLLLTALGFPP